MRLSFSSALAGDLAAFLAFKRARGYLYVRAEFMLRSFDRFLSSRARSRQAWSLNEVMLAWLARRPGRKAISVAMELSVIREFWRYLYRRDSRRFACEPRWPRLPTEPRFAAYVLTLADVRLLLRLTRRLGRPRFRRLLYRALILVLYCTGLRLGEALRLRIRDLDVRRRILFVAESKGRSRWVPFHASLAGEFACYLRARCAFVGREASAEDRVFVGWNRSTLPVSTIGYTFSKLYRSAGLKPARGRVGPRPYDLRHTFAVHRLTRWYRQGVDVHGRLPWLSTYLGHVDLLGTETYLTATPELMALAAARFHRRYERGKRRS
jgi:integrase/recombinase XerD